jgi:hypothetical protein
MGTVEVGYEKGRKNELRIMLCPVSGIGIVCEIQ